MKAISTAYPNRNNSHFTRESLVKAIPTVYNKPILGSFSVEADDFREHNSQLKWDKDLMQLYYDYNDPTSETPIGLIRSDDKVVIRDEEDGTSWLCLTCAIWVKYNYKQVKSLLQKSGGKENISVEVEVLDSYDDEKGIEIINEFSLDGITLLSNQIETGIAGAHLNILDMIGSSLFQKKQKCLCYAYNTLNSVNNPVESNENNLELDKQDFNKNNEDNNKVFSSDEVVDNANEQKEEITMNQEGGNKGMLSYETKRTLLEAFLNDKLDDDDDGFIWVSDLDDVYVYFNYKGNYYSAPYTFSQDGEGNNVVIVNLEEKKVVVRSWQVFVANDSDSKEPENKETEACGDKTTESCGDKSTCACDNKETEACGDKSTEACDNKSTEACGDKSTCACGDKSTESCGDKSTCACGDKSTESCGDKTTESCGDKSTCACGDKETEACGDKSTCSSDEDDENDDNKDNDMNDKEIDSKSTCACGDKATCSSDTFSKNEREFVMIGKDKVFIDGLFEKFNSLNNQFNELNEKYNSLDSNYNSLNDKYQSLFSKEQERELYFSFNSLN